MNAKEFERRLAARMPLKSSLLEEMLRETHEIVCKRFADSDSLDVPKFGTFEIAKQLEQIIPQPESGNRLLTPPRLTLHFNPASKLRTLLNLHDHE